MKYAALVFLFLILATPRVQGQPWVPVDCDQRVEEVGRFFRSESAVSEERLRFERTVRDARPGTTIYTPHPYARSEAALLENLRYGIEKVVVGDSEVADLPAGLRRLVAVLRADRLKVQILEINNWSLTRCRPTQPKPFYYLLRLSDGRGEFGRCALHDTGILGQCAFQPGGGEAESESQILSLDQVRDHLRRQFDLDWKIIRPQYVMADGHRFCSPIDPCISFRVGAETYLLLRNRLLFELDLARVTSASEYRRRRAEAGLPRLGHYDWEALPTSIGFGWANARLIAGLPEALP